MNTKPKYVASTTLHEARWANTTVLSGDLVAAIGELKAEPAGELHVHGSGTLTRSGAHITNFLGRLPIQESHRSRRR